ncbi:MAG: hypothetical protein JWN76_2532 [Chitinophagaceae bacterium]|nr:hypothetical protein [Chitinophagaceae bacterium]
MPAKNIDDFFAGLNDKKASIVLKARDAMLAAHPGITVAIKWGQLTFCYGKANLAFIYSFPQTSYVNIGFFKATLLRDNKGLFEGTGGKMRHIKVHQLKDIPVVQLKQWVKEAVLLESVDPR